MKQYNWSEQLREEYKENIRYVVGLIKMLNLVMTINEVQYSLVKSFTITSPAIVTNVYSI